MTLTTLISAIDDVLDDDSIASAIDFDTADLLRELRDRALIISLESERKS